MNHLVRWAFDTPEFGGAARRVRRQARFTQSELAERIGVTRMTISRLERGESVSIDTALKALSECGYAVALAPKFSRLVVQDTASDGGA